MTAFAFWNSGDQFFVWGANVLLQVTLVTAIALAIAALVRRSPAVRYWVLCSSLLLVLLSPVIALVMQLSGRSLLSVSLMHETVASVTDTTEVGWSVETQRVEAPLPLEGFAETPNLAHDFTAEALDPLGVDDLGRQDDRYAELGAAIEVTSALPPPEPTPSEEEAIATPLVPHQAATWIGKTLRVAMPPLLLVWLSGALFLLARLAVGWCRLVAILRSAKPNTSALLAESFERVGRTLQVTRTPELVMSKRVTGPIAAGVFRPRVVLPERMVDRVTPEQLRDILVHEVAHIVRRDQMVVLLQHLAAAIYWLHPLAKVLNRHLAEAREEICDNYVLDATDAPSYSRTLLTLAELVQTARPLPGAVGLFTSRWKLERRIAGLLDERRSRMIRLTTQGKTLVVALSLVMATITALGTVTLAVGHSDPSAATPVAEPSVGNEASRADSSVIVAGVVLKPDGTPAAGATIRAAVGVWAEIRRFLGEDFETPMSVETADERGRFTIPIHSQPYGDVSMLNPRWSEQWKQTRIAATADGFGPAWAVYDEIDPDQSITLQLVDDLPIRGRVIDLEGRAIAGTMVKVSGPKAAENEDLSAWFRSIKAGEPSWTAHRRASRSVDTRLIGMPEKMTTDEDGSFEIRGFGRERIIGLVFEGESVAHRAVNVITRKMPPIQRVISIHDPSTEPVFGAEFTFTAAPARPIEGRVVDANTRESLAGVTVRSYKLANYPYAAHAVINTTTNEEGHFRLVGMPKAKGNIMMLVPNDDQPYLMRRIPVPDPAGVGPVSMTIELHRGIWITGRVTDKATGEGVPGVRMHYLPFRTNEFVQALPEFDDNGNVDGDQMRYQSKADGTYRLVGLPGRAVVGAESILKPYRYGVGYQAIDAPKEGKSDWLLTYRNPINPSPKWPSVMREINPDDGVEEVKLDLQLDPGASIKIRIVDQRDQPVTGAEINGLSSRVYMAPTDEPVQTAVNFGPEETRPIIIHHKDRNIGRVVRVGPQQIAKGKIQVKLLSCATVTGRLLSKDEPLPGLTIEPRVLPGGDFSKSLPPVATDTEGRFTCTLVPGCKYNLHAQGQGLDFYATIANKLAVEPGETIDLDTLTLGKDRKFVAVAEEASQDTSAAAKPRAKSDAVAITRIIRGTVAAPDGKPAAGAFVAMVGLKSVADAQPTSEVLAEGVADGAGRYELSLQDVSSKTHVYPNLVARTEQSGITWHRVDLDADQTTLNVKLKPQQLIQVQLVDLEGQPAADLPVELLMIKASGDNQIPALSFGMTGLIPGPKAWPSPVKTDDRGLLTLTNIPVAHGVLVKVLGNQRFAPQMLSLNTGATEERGEHDGTYRSLVKNMKPGEVATISIAPARFFEGLVLLGESDKPAANARITIWASQQEPFGSMVSLDGTTDAEGHFRLNPYPGIRFGIIAYPPKGSPHQVKQLRDLHWSSGEASKNIEIRLDRGVLARGTIVDAETSKPLRGASIQYKPDTVNNKNLTDEIITGWQGIQKTNDAGEFAITVFPGPGTLLVHTADGNYVLQEIGSRELDGRSGGARMYAHAFHKINPKVDEPFDAMKIEVEPGASVKGALVDAKGNPIEHALVISRLKIIDHSPRWRGFPDEVSNGRFEINGLRKGEEYPVYLLDPKNRLGATAMISTQNASPTIVLEPCGSATAQFVDPEGKPVASGLSLGLYMVVTPGKPKHDLRAIRRGEMVADEDFISNIDRVNYRPSRTTNTNGEIAFPVLIPGARYRFVSFVKGNARVSKEFIAKSGETYEMGEIEVQINQ